MYVVLMVREAGARKVYFASCAPPITNAHIYGKSPLTFPLMHEFSRRVHSDAHVSLPNAYATTYHGVSGVGLTSAVK